MAQGYAVAVKLIDLATGPLANINKAIKELDSNAKKASGTGRSIQARDALNTQKERLENIKKTRDGLKDLRNKADDVSDSFRKMFGPLGLEGIGALASAGGIALASVQFARLGSEIGRTSTTLGINTADLQKWQGAADLAGVGAEAITSSISGLARGVYLMRNGLDPDMFRVVRRWGLDANKGATDAEKAANLILQVADKFKNDPALKGNKQAQTYLLEQLHIDPKTLYLLDQGRQKIEDLMEQARRNSLLTDQQIAQSFELQHAFSGLQQAVGGLGNQIGADLSPKMTFALQKTTEWIDRLKESPGAMKAVEVAGEALFIGAVARWAPALIRLVGNVTGLTKALTFLFKIPGMSVLGPLGAFLGTLWGGPLNEGEPNLMRYRHGGGIKVNKRIGLQSFQMGGIPLLPPGAKLGATEQARIGKAVAAYEKLGWDHNDAVAIAANQFRESGLQNIPGDSGAAQGFGQWHPDRQANFRKLFGHDVKEATDEEQIRFTDWELRNTEAAAAARMRAAKTVKEKSAILSKYYERPKDVEGEAKTRASLADRIAQTLSPIGTAWGAQTPEANANATVRVRTGTGTRTLTRAEYDAYVRETGNQPALAPSAAPPPGWAAPSYAPAVPSIIGPASGGAVGPQSMNLDTSHRVEVHFVNAPPGMRSGLTKSTGPAEVSVRTHYSMDDLS